MRKDTLVAGDAAHSMGRRVLFGIELKPYLRQYLLIKLGYKHKWDSPYGLELSYAMEQTLDVQFMRVDPGERAQPGESFLKMQGFLQTPLWMQGRYVENYYVSRDKEKRVRQLVWNTFSLELLHHTDHLHGDRSGGIRTMMEQYALSGEAVEEGSLRVLLYRYQSRPRETFARLTRGRFKGTVPDKRPTVSNDLGGHTKLRAS